MRSIAKFLLSATLVVCVLPTTAAAQAPAVDQQAVQALERSRAYLRTLRSFEIRAQTTIQEVLEDDTKIDLLTHVRYEYSAPNKLFADWTSDRFERQLFFDGSTLTIYAPRVGYFAQTPFQGTVGDMLEQASKKLGMVFPLPDLFYWAASDARVYDVDGASYIGAARIAGVDLDHYVFKQPDLDWQLWLERGERPLPRKIVMTDLTEPSRPTLTALIAWNPDVQLGSERFAFNAAAGIDRIEIGLPAGAEEQ